MGDRGTKGWETEEPRGGRQRNQGVGDRGTKGERQRNQGEEQRNQGVEAVAPPISGLGASPLQYTGRYLMELRFNKR